MASWTHSRRTLALLLCALFAGTLVPAANAYVTTQPIVNETITLPLLSPTSGSGYFVKSNCANGQSCIHLNPGGRVDYSFSVSSRVDTLFAYGTSSSAAGSCYVHYWYEHPPSGDYRGLTMASGCPPSTSNRFGYTSEYPFESSGNGAIFSVGIECATVFGCTGFDLYTFKVDAGHNELTLWTGPAPGTAVFTRCIDIQVTGSLWHAPDYLRISWGDGTETFIQIDWDTWMWWNYGVYDARPCHTYAPSVLPYQACVTVHDALERFLRECRDMTWIGV